MSEPTEAQASPKSVLADYLAKCQAAVAHCLRQAEEHDDPEQAMAAARLIKTSIDLVGAIEGHKREVTFRFLNERANRASGEDR